MKYFAIVAGAALASSAQAADAPAGGAAAAFGARQQVESVSISPDGKTIAIIEPTAGRGAALLVANLDGTPVLKPIMVSSGSPDRLMHCDWSGNTRLVCSIYMINTVYAERVGISRLIAVNSDGSGIRELTASSNGTALAVLHYGGNVIDWSGNGSDGSVLLNRWYVPEETTGTMLASNSNGLGVELVDTRTLKRRNMVPPNEAAENYITDGHGIVRVMAIHTRTSLGASDRTVRYLYHKKGSGEWLPLSETVIRDDKTAGFEPVAVDPDLDVAYGFEPRDGRMALFKVALDGSLKKELVFERPDVDVSGVVQVGRQSRVVGVSWITDKLHTAFFDPQLRQLEAAFSRALQGLPVSFVDASADEQRLVLWAGSDTDPGHFYLFDKATKHLTEIAPVRPQLAGYKLATVASITYPAADGTMIPAYLTLPAGGTGKNLPTIIMPHGGPESRDVWSFDYLAQYFANRGYAVLQPNYRGSTGYGEAWFAKNGYRSWRTAIGDVNDAGKWMVAQGIAKPDQLAIFGWSYGGFAALQSAVVAPNLFKAIVAVAPVTDIAVQRQWQLDRYHEKPELMDERYGKGPDVVAGSPALHADRFVAPVLLFHGDVDQNVDITQSRRMASRLKDAGKQVELVEFHGLDHYLQDDVAETQLLGKADAFLRTSMHLPPAP
ncbi:MAG: peptidase prolyl oligopeptidase active site domain protein [Sphingomonas bacterium]|nr:peptidase prolyl oligopeptidase active site domain protein [Sphingomonas bacterium]